MVRSRAIWEAWEARYIANHPPDFHRNLQLLEGMYELARTLGAFPPDDPWEGLDTDISVAKALNVPAAFGNDRSQPR